jgi:hypothetical protein
MISITIQRLQKLPKLLLSIFGVLFVLNLLAIITAYAIGHGSLGGTLEKFYFVGEMNFPKYFSSFDLLLAAGLLLSIYYYNKIKNNNDKKYWLVLSIVFLCLALDELIALHELLIRPTRDILENASISSTWLFFPWTIAGSIFVLVMGLFFYKFFFRLPSRYKVLFFISAALLIVGSIGMEILDGHFYNSDVTTTSGLIYYLLTTLEESMEMIGGILFIYSLINYMQFSQLEIRITGSSTPKHTE